MQKIRGGYFILAREMLKSILWTDLRPEDLKLAVYCIGRANHHDGYWFDGNNKVLIKRGQFATGRKELSNKLKLSERKIRTSLNHLRVLEFLTIKATNKYSIITIVNYDFYQNPDNYTASETTSKCPKPDQSPTTNNKNKEEKNIYLSWIEKPNLIKHVKLTSKMASKIKVALKSFSCQAIKKAIDNYNAVLDNPDIYFFTYKWTIQDFMARGVEKFVDEAEPLQNFLSDKKPKVKDWRE